MQCQPNYKVVYYMCLLGLLCLTQFAPAQVVAPTDSLSKKDSTNTKAVDSTAYLHSPRKATLYSTFLPGLGQVYNHKAWKIPIIYAGFGALGYSLWFNNHYYQRYKGYYEIRLNDATSTIGGYGPEYTAEIFKSARDYYRRYRDLTIIGCFALYVLNIIDATVDGYFYEYDISNDLGMKVGPAMIPTDKYASPGVSILFNFK
jgi:hypothetical protein